MLQLLTPTGSRHESWALCCKWMAAQTYQGPVKWVIVDDGPEAQDVPVIRDWDIQVIRRRPYWREGQNTQCRNLLAGLEHIDRRHPLLIIEDDEHYRPEYLATMAEALKNHKLVGQKGGYKYNVRLMRWKHQKNDIAASLCATAMRDEVIDTFHKITESRPKLIDLCLWAQHRRDGKLLDNRLVTGIKCMPGRGGIDSGHEPNMKGYDDPTGRQLYRWVGKDAEEYLRYANNGRHDNICIDAKAGNL